MSSAGVFASFRPVVYKYRYAATLRVNTICGGIPSDPNVAESWIKTRLGLEGTDEALGEAVTKTMAERAIPADQAAAEVAALKHLNGFKRDENGLYIEGRQVKAAIKEAVSVTVSAGNMEQKGYGTTKKWISGFLPEHVFVAEDIIYLTAAVTDENGEPILGDDGEPVGYRHITEPTDIHQRFVSTRYGTGIQREEYVDVAYLHFTVLTDYDFDKSWGPIWVTGEQQGVGAARSQGYGRYVVTRWTELEKHVMEQTLQINAGPGRVHDAAAAYAERKLKGTAVEPVVGNHPSMEDDLSDGAYTAPEPRKAVKALKSVAKAAPKKDSSGLRPAAAI